MPANPDSAKDAGRSIPEGQKAPEYHEGDEPVATESGRSSGSSEQLLTGRRMSYLVGYNLILAVLLAPALILLVTFSPYLPMQNGPGVSLHDVEAGLLATIVLTTLLTMLVAGSAGATLCNLRALFKHIDLQKGNFPARLEMPLYIRPLTGALTGLFTFFVGFMVVSSFSLNAADAGWATLLGRLPYIAVALLAGFAAQEFMERLKEVARALFSRDGD